MSLNILITGGAGYIGSVLTERLLKDGNRVTVVDNFLYRQSSLMHLVSNPNLKIIKLDIRNDHAMEFYLAKADVIIPLAAIVGAPACNADPFGSRSVNHDAAIRLFKKTSKSQMILMPTTNSAYGSGDINNYCDENSELKPISSYAQEKVEVEKILLDSTQGISFRLATVFGASPRMRLDLLVNDFTYRAVTDRFIVLFEAHFKRNYIHIQDVAEVFVHGIKNYQSMKGQVYNVGLSQANVSKLELCQIIKKIIPDFVFIESEIGKDPDQRNYIVSNEKVEGTGFSTRFSIEAGVLDLVKALPMLGHFGQKNV